MVRCLSGKLSNISSPWIGLLQAFGVVSYCSLVGLVFWKGNNWFGVEDKYWTPVLVLTLLSVSVLTCALLVFAHPFILFWEEKKPKEALKTVVATALWLVLFILLLMFLLVI